MAETLALFVQLRLRYMFMFFLRKSICTPFVTSCLQQIKVLLLPGTWVLSESFTIDTNLPTPKEKTIKMLESTFNNCIWNNKPPKFRKEILENTNKLGGLKLTNSTVFNNVLKISWLKHLKKQNDGWEKFPRHYKIHKIIIFGDKYPSLLSQKIDNPFLNDVVKSCITLHNIVKKENNNAYNVPLWFNSDINITFKKEWFAKGYTSLGDILDRNGNLFTFREIENRGLTIHFLDYEKLRYDIHKLIGITKDCEMFGPYLPYTLFKIGYNIKGCAEIYNLLMNFNNNIVKETQ